MADFNADRPHRLLRTAEAARFLSLSDRTLEKHRCYNTGPTYLKLGGRVVYKLDDLRIWAEKGARSSTKELPATRVLPPKPQGQSHRGAAN